MLFISPLKVKGYVIIQYTGVNYKVLGICGTNVVQGYIFVGD